MKLKYEADGEGSISKIYTFNLQSLKNAWPLSESRALVTGVYAVLLEWSSISVSFIQVL